MSRFRRCCRCWPIDLVKTRCLSKQMTAMFRIASSTSACTNMDVLPSILGYERTMLLAFPWQTALTTWRFGLDLPGLDAALPCSTRICCPTR